MWTTAEEEIPSTWIDRTEMTGDSWSVCCDATGGGEDQRGIGLVKIGNVCSPSGSKNSSYCRCTAKARVRAEIRSESPICSTELIINVSAWSA